VSREAAALDENIQATQNIKRYIETQEKNFPEITIIKLENL